MYSASTVIESTHPSPPTARTNGASGLARAHATAKIGSATRSALVPPFLSEKLRRLAPFFPFAGAPVPICPVCVLTDCQGALRISTLARDVLQYGGCV
ncbi:hypothetical protein MRX96_058492 [Rhipicephalus microplus]